MPRVQARAAPHVVMTCRSVQQVRPRALTARPGSLLRVALQTHGPRARSALLGTSVPEIRCKPRANRANMPERALTHAPTVLLARSPMGQPGRRVRHALCKMVQTQCTSASPIWRGSQAVLSTQRAQGRLSSTDLASTRRKLQHRITTVSARRCRCATSISMCARRQQPPQTVCARHAPSHIGRRMTGAAATHTSAHTSSASILCTSARSLTFTTARARI